MMLYTARMGLLPPANETFFEQLQQQHPKRRTPREIMHDIRLRRLHRQANRLTRIIQTHLPTFFEQPDTSFIFDKRSRGIEDRIVLRHIGQHEGIGVIVRDTYKTDSQLGRRYSGERQLTIGTDGTFGFKCFYLAESTITERPAEETAPPHEVNLNSSSVGMASVVMLVAGYELRNRNQPDIVFPHIQAPPPRDRLNV